jgi:hypothetical protein
MTTKSASGASRCARITPAAMGRKRDTSGLLGIHAAENSDQRVNATAEIEQDGGTHEQIATETDARQPARFAAAGILVAAKKIYRCGP